MFKFSIIFPKISNRGLDWHYNGVVIVWMQTYSVLVVGTSYRYSIHAPSCLWCYFPFCVPCPLSLVNDEWTLVWNGQQSQTAHGCALHGRRCTMGEEGSSRTGRVLLIYKGGAGGGSPSGSWCGWIKRRPGGLSIVLTIDCFELLTRLANAARRLCVGGANILVKRIIGHGFWLRWAVNCSIYNHWCVDDSQYFLSLAGIVLIEIYYILTEFEGGRAT